jgi:transposase
MVCAPSLIPKKPGDRVKTDRRDAIKLVRALRAGDLSAVYVPGVEDEAFRDLARAWAAAKADLRQARQRLKSFLLAHGVGYTGTANWGPAHRRWISSYSFASHWQQLAFDEHRRTIEDRLAQCERLEAALREAVPEWRFYPAVLGLQAMRGIQFTTAIGILSELGDLSRFGWASPPLNTLPGSGGVREASRKPATATPESCWSRPPGATGFPHV